MVFNELDEWAFDLEWDLMTGKYVNRSKLQKKIMKLQILRDKYYEMYLKEYRKSYGNGAGHNPSPKSCRKRFLPPLPPKSQPK